MMYAYSVSTKHSLVVAVVALAVIGSAQRVLAEPHGGLIWFTDQAEFEAFMQDQGKVLKGTEDFEESILPPGALDHIDDPLQSGVPNLPDGFSFPDGMTGLPNLTLQSNLGGGDPSDENPRGLNGLAALSPPAFGAVSDVVVPNFFADSLDLIFTEDKSGVGFNTLTIMGGPSVEVRAYSTTNVFLGMMVSPADAAGTNFIGVWSDIPIGRINIFDPTAGRSEGGDNIQAWDDSEPCPWDLDGSGSVDTSDLLALFAQWGTAGPADFDASGTVDTADLLILFANWGPCP